MENSTESLRIPDNKTVFKISEAADLLGVKPYVLRYWETEFPEARPKKSYSGQRVYHPEDIRRIGQIRDLLYSERYSIAGARAVLRERRLQPKSVAPVSNRKAAGAGESVVATQKRECLTSVLKELRKLKRSVEAFGLTT